MPDFQPIQFIFKNNKKKKQSQNQVWNDNFFWSINKLNFVNIVQFVFIYSLENRYKWAPNVWQTTC